MGTDDLTPFLVPPPPGQGFRYGQGKLVAWNPTTFANQVAWKGAVLSNLPVLAGPSALTFVPGQIVALIGWAPSGGAGSWAILGQWVTPGSGAAQAQIQFMQSALAKEISAEVFAERVHNATVTGTQGTTSTSFVDLPDEVGPIVSDVDISPAGKALVTISAALIPPASDSAVMSFQVTGATSLAPDNFRSLAALRSAELIAVTCSVVIPVTLNPGSHTFTAKYKSDSGGSAGFSNRGLTVIAY